MLEDDVETVSHATFEQMIEMQVAERERLNLARERLSDIISNYAERYEEVRKLLKE